MAKKVGNIDHDSGNLISEHGFGHKKQPHGKGIGNKSKAQTGGGGVAKGSGSQPSGGKVGYIDHDKGKLISEGGAGHAKQPHRGDDTGAGKNDVAAHHVGHTANAKFGTGAGIFKAGGGSNAHGFRGTQKKGVLRVSGHGGAHQIGCKR